MTDDIRKFQRKVLDLAGKVRPRTRYRLLEMYARLEKLAEATTREPAGEPRPLTAKGPRVAA